MKNQIPHRKSTNKVVKIFLATILLLGHTLYCYAQLSPLQSMYYQNRYLYNPALAGIVQGMDVNLVYRKQWNGFPGAPKTSSFTLDGQPMEKVGLGVNISDDQAGLIIDTHVMGTYAYHVLLGDQNQNLSFGLSLGLDDSRLNQNNVNGDITDIEIAQYNQLKPYVDGGFGIAYTSNNFNVGAAIPNLKSTFFKASDQRFDVDRLLFITMASYKMPVLNDDRTLSLEPLLGLRIVKGYSDIVDAGLNFTLHNYGIYFQGIYHTNKSINLGFGLDQQTYALSFNYSLENGSLSNSTTGTFELGIKLSLFKNGKRTDEGWWNPN